MEHDEIRSSIPAWATGRIDPVTRRKVEAHLAECAACSAAAATAVTLAGELGRDGAVLFDAHPDVDALRRHAQLPSSSRNAEIERHVASCASCALEVQAWRREPTVTNVGSPRRYGRRDLWIAAAGVAAGLLLGLFVARGSAVPEALPLHSVPRVLVQSALRGADNEPELVLEPTAAYGLIDAAFDLPLETAPDSVVRFEIRDAAGRSTWTATETASSVAARLARHELIGFLVPAEALTEGEHRLEVSSGGSTLLSTRFRVRAGDLR